jgi:Zn-finger nucleic acid-binding protein
MNLVMTQENKSKKRKGMCQCRSCGNIFHRSEIKKEERIHSGIEIKDNICPRCGGVSFGLMDEIYIKSDKWLYANARNYGDIDKFKRYL